MEDILIAGANLKDCYNKVKQVLERLQHYGVSLNKDKCTFFKKKVQYLGHRIDEEGIHPAQNLMDDIINAPRSTNVDELRSYIGLFTFYGKFLPNLSTLFHQLYTLEKRDSKWQWSEECEKAFRSSKTLLQEHNVLVHYDSNRPLILANDASPVGVGSVLSHLMEDGTERPIAFASQKKVTRRLRERR
jgi:hypothetical protein